jgi:hypothetical protein
MKPYTIIEIERYQAEDLTLLILKSNEDGDDVFGYYIQAPAHDRVEGVCEYPRFPYKFALQNGIHYALQNLGNWMPDNVFIASKRVPVPPDPLLEAAKRIHATCWRINDEFGGPNSGLVGDMAVLDAAIKEREGS